MSELVFLPASQLASLIRQRQASSGEVLEAHLRHIAQHNAPLNAIVTLNEEQARRRAHEADAALACGEIWGPFHGVPITIKDSFATAGLRTTSSYKPLAEYIPNQDATVVSRLRAAGAIILGKTNLPELAGEPQCNSPLFGRANNPWNLDRTPGGSTGGGAAAVAAGLSPLEVGSDLGGSIRIPAHFCGTFGLKPTEHLVPGTGHIPELPGQPRGIRHLGAFGPLARSVADLRMCLSMIAGPDGQDWEVPPVVLGTPTQKPLRDCRFAWIDEVDGIPVTTETRQTLEHLAERLSAAGCHVERCVPPDFSAEQALDAYGFMAGSEFALNIPPLLRRVTTYCAPLLRTKDRIWRASLRGCALDLSRYAAALNRRDALLASLEAFLRDWDAWLCPVASTPAFPHLKTSRTSLPPLLTVDAQAVPYWVAVAGYTSVFNFTGNPVVVLPMTHSKEGLPIGVQVVGRKWHDMELLAIAETLTEVTGSFQRPPGY